jgi:hypothetical protein
MCAIESDFRTAQKSHGADLRPCVPNGPQPRVDVREPRARIPPNLFTDASRTPAQDLRIHPSAPRRPRGRCNDWIERRPHCISSGRPRMLYQMAACCSGCHNNLWVVQVLLVLEHQADAACVAAQPEACTRNGFAAATSAPGLRSPLPHLHWDCAHRCHICTGTALTAATTAPGLRSPNR